MLLYQGQKRDLSPLLGNNLEQDEKCSQQNNNMEVSLIQTTPAGNRTINLLDNIMNKVKKVATKDDIVQIKGTFVLQSATIQQFREEISKHYDCLKLLEEQAGVHRAVNLKRTQQRHDVYSSSSSNCYASN